MQLKQRFHVVQILALLSLLGLSSCQSDGIGAGGTEPLNGQEEIEYTRALNRCLKTGGTRIVKILNQLRCY